MKRILIISGNYGKNCVDPAGKDMYELAKNLVALGNKVTVLTSVFPGYKEKNTNEVKVVILPSWGKNS